MSKESRRRQRASGQTPSANPPTDRPSTGSQSPVGGGSPNRSSGPRGTDRAGRRDRVRAGAKPSIFERYRTPIIAGVVLAVVAIAGVGLFSAATTPVYACSSTWEPAPTATPSEDASPQPGYVQPDMGVSHPVPGTRVNYTYCPPASGNHYNAQGLGPIPPRLYGPSDTVVPQGWLHNLEHGGFVLLYRGDSPAATEEGQAALRSFFEDYPPSPVCGFPAGSSIGPVFARFDEMRWPMAALVWGRVLPLQDLDTAAVLEFDKTYGEKTNPEKLCEPSPSPSASESVAPSAPPSASPSAAPSAAPSVSASPPGSATPSASSAPPASPSSS